MRRGRSHTHTHRTTLNCDGFACLPARLHYLNWKNQRINGVYEVLVHSTMYKCIVHSTYVHGHNTSYRLTSYDAPSYHYLYVHMYVYHVQVRANSYSRTMRTNIVNGAHNNNEFAGLQYIVLCTQMYLLPLPSCLIWLSVCLSVFTYEVRGGRTSYEVVSMYLVQVHSTSYIVEVMILVRTLLRSSVYTVHKCT